MKKTLSTTLLAILMCVCMVFGFAGCANQEDIDNAVNPLSEQITTINSSITALETADTAINSLIDTLEATAEDLQTELDTVNADITALEASDTATAEEIAALKTSKTTLEGQIATINTSITELKAKDTAIDGEIAALKTAVAACASNADIQAIQAQIAEITNSISVLSSEVGNLKTSLEAANSDIETIQTDIKELETKISELEANIQQLTKDNENLQIQINCLKGIHDWENGLCKHCETTCEHVSTVVIGNFCECGIELVTYSISETTAEINVLTGATAEGVKSTVSTVLSNNATTLNVKGITGEGEAQQALVKAVAEAIGEFETEATGPNVATVSLTMPDLKEISGYYLFEPSYALKEIDFPMVQTISQYPLGYAASLQKVSLASVTALPDYAFQGCNSLTEVYAPEVLTVGAYAFMLNKSLTSIYLPKATSIGEQAFSQCSALTTVHLPSVTTLEAFAFQLCNNLTSIKFGSVITSLGRNPFQGSFDKNCDLQLAEGQKDFTPDVDYYYTITENDVTFGGTSWINRTWKSISKYTADAE